MGDGRAAMTWTRRGSLLAALGGVAALTTAAALPGDGVAAGGTTPGAQRIHLIGDSWAAGLHADPAHALGQVAAQALGWPITVDALSGTGYLNQAGQRTYLQRAKASSGPDRLVILQGGSNDDGMDLSELGAAVTSTIGAVQQGFPDAAVLVLGPGPDPAPVTATQWEVDRIIGAAAQAAGVSWVSMLRERWIPEALIDAVIDPGNHHPTVSGQQYLGLRLAAAVHLRESAVLAS